MARGKQAAADKVETVDLVSPDGERKRTVNVGSNEEVSLRFDGYLPPDQAKLQAPERPTGSEGEQTVGTNA